MEKKQTFGEYLKKLRIKRGLTLKQLADLAGLSPSYLSRIERGERNVPNARLLKKLAPPLDLTPRQILTAAGYLNGEPQESGPDEREGSLYKRQEKEVVPFSLPEMVRDPDLYAALEEIGPLKEDEKEGLLLYLKAIKLRRDMKGGKGGAKRKEPEKE